MAPTRNEPSLGTSDSVKEVCKTILEHRNQRYEHVIDFCYLAI